MYIFTYCWHIVKNPCIQQEWIINCCNIALCFEIKLEYSTVLVACAGPVEVRINNNQVTNWKTADMLQTNVKVTYHVFFRRFHDLVWLTHITSNIEGYCMTFSKLQDGSKSNSALTISTWKTCKFVRSSAWSLCNPGWIMRIKNIISANQLRWFSHRKICLTVY